MNKAMEMKSQCTLLTIDELQKATGGFVIHCRNGNAGFDSVVTDSRNVVSGSLFVPLIGEFQDGHKYIPQAVEKGASVVFAAEENFSKNKEKYEQLGEKTTIVVVKNTLKAFQAAARAYVEKFPSLIKVGITGSSGKTTTKELCVSVLKQKYKVVYTQGNLNSETGLPLSVFKITAGDEAGIFEMGMNHKNEIGDLVEILKPKYAVITNIGTAHIGLLGSRENIAEEKRKIFNYIPEDGYAFIPEADDFADYLKENVKGTTVLVGKKSQSDEIKNIQNLGIEGTLFEYKGEKINLKLPGTYNFLNALSAVQLGKILGLTPCEIKNGIESVPVLDGRSQILHFVLGGKVSDCADKCADDGKKSSSTDKKLTVLQDCYNANPDSIEKALSLCESVTGFKCLVLGDMLELGEKSEEEHARIGKLAAKLASDGKTKLVFVGGEMKAAVKVVEESGIKNVVYSPEYDENAIRKIVDEDIVTLPSETFVLLKGSHGIGLERICRKIQEACNE